MNVTGTEMNREIAANRLESLEDWYAKYGDYKDFKALRIAINALRREAESLRGEAILQEELFASPAKTREEAILLVPVEILRQYFLANGPSQRAIVRDSYREWLNGRPVGDVTA